MSKKKTAVWICVLFMLLPFLPADIEKNTVKLAVAPEFGKGVDWDAVFSGYQGRGTYKNLARMSDGRWIVADSRTYNFFFFDESGRFLKTLWPSGLRNSDSPSLADRPEWISLLNDKFLFVYEPGRIRVFDLGGKQIRSTTISHPLQCFEALDERTVAIAGVMERTNLSKRYVAGLVDMETGKETIVMDSIERLSRKKAVPLAEDGSKTMSIDFPYAKIWGFVRRTPEGGFLAGFSNWPEIEIYDKSGRQLRIIMLKTERAVIEKRIIDSGVALAKPIVDLGIERFISGYLAKHSSDGSVVYSPLYDFPQGNPYYYNLAIDDAGKMIIFYFPIEGEKPVFQTYSLAGDLSEEVILDPGEYELLLTPAASGIVFSKGYLFALAEKKNVQGIRLRLVKCQMKLGASNGNNSDWITGEMIPFEIF